MSGAHADQVAHIGRERVVDARQLALVVGLDGYLKDALGIGDHEREAVERRVALAMHQIGRVLGHEERRLRAHHRRRAHRRRHARTATCAHATNAARRCACATACGTATAGHSGGGGGGRRSRSGRLDLLQVAHVDERRRQTRGYVLGVHFVHVAAVGDVMQQIEQTLESVAALVVQQQHAVLHRLEQLVVG